MTLRIALILIITAFSSGLKAQVSEAKYLLPEDWTHEYKSRIYAIIVDTRTNKEFKKDRIEGAVNVPAMTNLIPFADSLDRETPLFIYCDAEARANTVAVWLSENDFSQLYILKGGFTDWKAFGMPVEKKRIRKRSKRSG